MSKTDYQFSKMPADWLKCKELNPTDKYILAFLILENRADFNKVYKKGFEALGLETGLSRRQCIYIINKLEKLHFIEINNRTRPVEIRVCLERVGGRNQDNGKSATDCTLATINSATDCTQRVQFDAKNSATDCTHNRYLNNLNINTRDKTRECPSVETSSTDGVRSLAFAHEFKETETADVAAVRSMPDAGQAGENTRQGNEARFGLSDLNDCQRCLESIQGASDFSFLKSGKYLLFRPKGKFAKVTDEIKNNITSFFSDKCGKMIFFVDAGMHYENEQKIV